MSTSCLSVKQSPQISVLKPAVSLSFLITKPWPYLAHLNVNKSRFTGRVGLHYCPIILLSGWYKVVS